MLSKWLMPLDFLESRGPITLGCLNSSECMSVQRWKPGELVLVPLFFPSENPHFLGFFLFFSYPSQSPKSLPIWPQDQPLITA